MWQEVYGGKTIRFQSENKKIRERMRQRSDFIQIGWCKDPKYIAYQVRFYSPKEAKRTLGRITRSIVKKDSKNNLYYAETGAIVANKNNPEV